MKMSIGEYIKQKRKEKGLTQEELGKLLYVTDKAVSKWERNVGLPDITILNELAKVLDTNVNSILNGSDNVSREVDLEKELDDIKNNMLIKKKKQKKLIMLISSIVIIIILILILGNYSFGYKVKKLEYKDRIINLGIPKTSFMYKYNDKSYSFKNFRNKSILENEIKKYLKTLKYATCNDTIYYYNDTDNFSIISYQVDNHLLYNTVSYTINDNDYCYVNQMNEYGKLMGGLKRIHKLDSSNDLLTVYFIDGGNDNNLLYEFKANLKISYNNIVLEDSIGNYEIKDNKLYYYRTNITKKDNNINIPEVSVFKLDNGKMLLNDNYLSNYYNKDIILK